MSERTKAQRLSDVGEGARLRCQAAGGGDAGWSAAVAPLIEISDGFEAHVERLIEERDTLAAEVKRLTACTEHLGANLTTAREDVARLEREATSLHDAFMKAMNEADQHKRRANRLAAGIDALVERYSDLQRGAR